MAFVKSASTGLVTSFARYSDVVEKDPTLFSENEGLTEDIINASLKRATERILTKLRATDWWRSYYVRHDPSLPVLTVADIPALDPNKIIDRINDFTEMCVDVALSEYIYPKVADFSTEDTSEREKMKYYTAKEEMLFGELITAGDWYDFDGTGAMTSSEKVPGRYNLKRVR